MKKIVAVAAALMLTSSIAMACPPEGCQEESTSGLAAVTQAQGQLQVGDGVSYAGGGTSAFAGGYAGIQGQAGAGGFLFFGSASDSQSQSQGQSWGTGANDGNGNFATTSWSAVARQSGGGEVASQRREFAGGYVYTGAQAQAGGSAGFSTGGQFGIAGSAYAGFGQSNAAEFARDGFAKQENRQEFSSRYEIQSVGANGGYIYQTGSQHVGMANGARTSYCGPGASEVAVVQFGGTVAMNDGQGTAMAGGGLAVSGGTAKVTDGKGFANFKASQTHSYEQSVIGPRNQWQQANGTVSTSVGGGVNVDGGHKK